MSDIAALEKLTSLRTISLVPSAVSLEFPGLPTEQSHKWQSRINRQLEACGCTEGGLLAIASLAAYFAYLSLNPAVALSIWAEVGIGLAVICVGSLLGKVIGLLRAQRLLRRAVAELRILLETRALSQ